jgi:hypothetical protein
MTSLPTYHYLAGDERFSTVRGLGAISYAPASSAGEENLLCAPEDRLSSEDILVRELAAGILHLAVTWAESTQFLSDLQRAYEQARINLRWAHTYASLSPTAYFVSTYSALLFKKNHALDNIQTIGLYVGQLRYAASRVRKSLNESILSTQTKSRYRSTKHLNSFCLHYELLIKT